jgi:pimeloyl-ACP methyl ester carboxylesterase
VVEDAVISIPTPERTERYRRAEQRLWERYGLEPSERFLELDSPRIRLRVLEVGAGAPLLFAPGSGGSGPMWAPLVQKLQGVRCLMLDPPNSGLSSRLGYAGRRYGDVIGEVLRGVADRLELERIDVVGFSLGNVSALRLAEAEPERVGRVVLLGGGPLPDAYRVPGILRVIASPLGAVMVRLPPGRRSTRAFLRQLGHGRSLAAGRIPDELLDWHIAFDRNTDTLRNERDMVRALTDWRRGSLRQGVSFTVAELRRIAQPTLLVYGSADPTGSLERLRPLVETLPRGELKVIDDAGHMLWLDEPASVAAAVAGFLTSTESEVTR